MLPVLGVGGVTAALEDLGPLGDLGKVAVLQLTDAPGYGAVFRQSVFQQEAHHGVFPVTVGLAEKVSDGHIGAAAVKIVGIDDGKGAVHLVLGAEHGVPRSPGLGSALRHLEAGGEHIYLLKGVGNVDMLFQTGRDLAEILLDGLFDDEDHLAEAGLHGIIDGVVQDAVALIVHRRHLLEAAEAAAHSGGKDH